MPHNVTPAATPGDQNGHAPPPPSSVRDLFPVVYEQLRALAQRWLERRPGEDTLQPTALVHEVYLRLLKNANLAWTSRNHFVAIAATAMRHILNDAARRRLSDKRGGGWTRVTLNEAITVDESREHDAFALADALKRLEALHERHCRVVEMRLLGGLDVDAISEVLEVSSRTVERDWHTARAWLAVQMKGR